MEHKQASRSMFFIFSLGVFISLLTSPWAAARDASFTWTANTEQVDGYRLYYKTGESGGESYNGTGAQEGNSPVDTGNVTAFTLHGLDDNQTYHFTLTAYRGELESDYSEEVVWAAAEEPPVATAADHVTSEDQPVSSTVHASNITGLPITYMVTRDTMKGNLSFNTSTGAFTYTPNENSNGLDSFIYTASDDNGTSAPAIVTLSVSPVNDAPVAGDLAFFTQEEKQLSGALAGSDIDSMTLQYTVAVYPQHGDLSLTNSSAGIFSYTPATGFNGTDSFTYQVNDGSLNSNTATVLITVNETSNGPIASNMVISLTEDNIYSGNLNGTSPNSNNLVYAIYNNADHGTAEIVNSSTGAFTYIPRKDYYGKDFFTFTISDGNMQSAAATVSIIISPLNDPPQSHGELLVVNNDSPYTGILQATDIENNEITFSIVSDPASAIELTDPVKGVYTFTPHQEMGSTYSFCFIAGDGANDSEKAEVTFYVKDSTLITKMFGDAVGSDFPGTILDTFANLNHQINAESESISLWSWSSTQLNTPANTVILKTNFDSLPQNAIIHDARLFLYQVGATGEQNYSCGVHKITGKSPKIEEVTGYDADQNIPWTTVEEDMTENAIPLGLADIAPAEDTIDVPIKEGLHSWEITTMVQDWVAKPQDNKGLLIAGGSTTSETGRVFAASENQAENRRPRILLSYSIKPAAPTILNISEK